MNTSCVLIDGAVPLHGVWSINQTSVSTICFPGNVRSSPSIVQIWQVLPENRKALGEIDRSHAYCQLLWNYYRHCCMQIEKVESSGIILYMHPANERWRYSVTPSLIGWVHKQNDLWVLLWHGTFFPNSKLIQCKDQLTNIGIHFIKIRLSWDCLTFIMIIPMLVIRHPCIESVPRFSKDTPQFDCECGICAMFSKT